MTLPELAAYGMTPDAVLSADRAFTRARRAAASRFASTACSSASILVGCPASHGWSFPPAV